MHLPPECLALRRRVPGARGGEHAQETSLRSPPPPHRETHAYTLATLFLPVGQGYSEVVESSEKLPLSFASKRIVASLRVIPRPPLARLCGEDQYSGTISEFSVRRGSTPRTCTDRRSPHARADAHRARRKGARAHAHEAMSHCRAQALLAGRCKTERRPP